MILPKISIIIPIVNEAGSIVKCLSALPKDSLLEFILVDGGSTDSTLSTIKQYLNENVISKSSKISVISSELGRAKQMNAGAKHACGSSLVFLHADSVVPNDFLKMLKAFDCQNQKVWGRFDIRLSNPNFSYRVIETFINYRSVWTNIATGDQAIFVKRDVFENLGGFPDIPLMEDIAISKLLKNISSAYRIKSRLQTSSRRWEKNGVITTVIFMWYLRFSYFLGVSPEKLHKIYYRI
jgi:rSAM/selenodomain-associated transferase 2